MAGISIRDRCRIVWNEDRDGFVGIMCRNGEFTVHFPLGFPVSQEEKELRKDIFLLMGTISVHAGRKGSEVPGRTNDSQSRSFPFQAYLSILHDFFARGYYREREHRYQVAKRGKIHWGRTIRSVKPCVQNQNVFYLEFVTGKRNVKEDELITLIHEYCVYEAFAGLGWLFTEAMPGRPRLKYNKKRFTAAVMDKLQGTFQDKNKELFRNMLAVIRYLGERDQERDFQYGTWYFEHVWERLIDRVFGIPNKKDYYPQAFWETDTREGRRVYESSLRPDTIMLYGGDVYVLDAKYYQYGVTGDPKTLPSAPDINKQITYGEYIAEQEKFRQRHGEGCKVYNAFLIPFDRGVRLWAGAGEMMRLGQARGSWKSGRKEYEKVQGILVDLKYLMKLSVREDENEIARLAECIRRYVNAACPS